ncbi:MAG: hypothetical protein AVDCRST_MAG67-780 [uncultured Solirubrobacteraceae bacterium]|uniref:IrrE N-terminal-like domain-containing protein n=1 Tax=uncultured Solirubrobacteraceae bacterium TaxID=1162706 RepID=A0A6J4RSD1_9ACTN|nr:MAG: hypothetical protein AVDCRST_MAG67-780 [uncultured Solirubrobacteraceae bacterium]
MAHELGHHFLGNRHRDEPLAEQEASSFAGELLVPGTMLESAMKQTTATGDPCGAGPSRTGRPTGG